LFHLLFLVHPDARNASLSAATVQHVREGRFFGEWRPESCDENCRLRWLLQLLKSCPKNKTKTQLLEGAVPLISGYVPI
jgi:hypothetical protein